MKRSDRRVVIRKAVEGIGGGSLSYLTAVTHIPRPWNTVSEWREREAMRAVGHELPGHPIKWATADEYHEACKEEQAQRKEATCAGATT